MRLQVQLFGWLMVREVFERVSETARETIENGLLEEGCFCSYTVFIYYGQSVILCFARRHLVTLIMVINCVRREGGFGESL